VVMAAAAAARCWRRKRTGYDDMSAAAVNRGFCRVRQTVRPDNSSSAVGHNYIHVAGVWSLCEIHISEPSSLTRCRRLAA